ncbi:MAG: site-2 protease family protein [Chloroflexota bacterium]|nr:site-2 protease family protein [Chloroflexota bacterium]
MFGNFDTRTFLPRLLALVIAIAIHEFAHAASAMALGDDTARRQGRLTLNPVAHFDPVGFIMLAFMAAFGFGFAWGRPVPVNPYALRGGRRGMALTAFAGPLSNLVQAALAVAVLRLVGAAQVESQPFLAFLNTYIVINILLAAFNMLPVPPLDGYNVLMGVVSDFWVQRLEPLRNAGVGLLLLLVFFGYQYVSTYAIGPVAGLFARIVGYG